MNEFRKLMNIMENRVDGPEVTYRMENDNKSKALQKEFTRVVAQVTGRTSARFTKLAKKFIEIEELNKRVTELRDSTNEENKRIMEGFFDAGDNIYTRVIKTKSIALTMAKDTVEKEVRTETFNSAEFMKDLDILMEGLDQEVISSIQLLIEKHTTVENVFQKERKGRITHKLATDVSEDIGSDLSKAKKIADLVEDVTDLRMKKFDGILDSLEAKY